MFMNAMMFSLGGFSYIVIELLWRGRSHWSMFALGGLCFMLIGIMDERARGRLPAAALGAAGAALITTLEFVTGWIVNIKLHMNVWSYADAPLNVMGQICLPYAALWFFAAIGCARASAWLKDALRGV